MSFKTVIGAAIAAAAGACASTPNVTASYYFPKAETQITITQSLACNSAATRIIAATAVAPSTTYTSDLERGDDGNIRQGRLRYADLDGFFSDADITLNF